MSSNIEGTHQIQMGHHGTIMRKAGCKSSIGTSVISLTFSVATIGL